MQRFQRSAPFAPAPLTAPPVDDRSGPPLSGGSILKLLATVASEHLDPDTLATLDQVDPDAWLDGQHLETLLNRLEDRDPSLPHQVGRLVHLMMRSELRKLSGTPRGVLEGCPALWMQVTRGDTGVWRTTILGDRRARIEMEQPFNCRFEEGGVFGLLEVYDAIDIVIDHQACMRNGAPFCALDVRWAE